MKRFRITKEELTQMYDKGKLNTYQIAHKIGCCQATIWKLLIKYKIPRRKPHELNSNIPSKEELIKLYRDKNLSTWRIEKDYGYSRGTIHRKLKEYGIETRNRAVSHIKYKRTDFSGNLTEKAYLIGFRLGDLGVRKKYLKSETICVASGSTIREQIDLIKKLFEKYGKIWIQKTKNNKINIQTNLNESFSFLLSKDFPEWTEENKEHFFSFLAGFTDAEGCISKTHKIDYYSLGNYDNKLLFIIYKNLNKYRIKCGVPREDNRKGKMNSQGYRYSSNYWSIRIYNKENLLKLLLALKPYIKHQNKVKALNIAISSINNRNRRYKNA